LKEEALALSGKHALEEAMDLSQDTLCNGTSGLQKRLNYLTVT